MSLVINANNQEQNVRSNSIIDFYPDIQQILVQPKIAIAQQTKTEWQNTATVSWIIRNISINAFQDNFLSPEIYFWSLDDFSDLWSQKMLTFWYFYQETASSWTYNLSNKEQYLIIGIDWTIDEWHTIWKRIRFAPNSLQFNCYSNNSAQSVSWYCSFMLWLLHEDWTISYWTEHQIFSVDYSWTWQQSVLATYNEWLKEFNSNWLVSSDWDYILIKLICHLTDFTKTKTHNYQDWFWLQANLQFWNQWPKSTPFEISLD